MILPPFDSLLTPRIAILAQLALLAALLLEWRRRRSVHQQLSQHVLMQQALTNIAIRFLSDPPERIEQQIERALSEIGGCLAMKRMAIWTRSDHGFGYQLCYWWSQAGEEPPAKPELVPSGDKHQRTFACQCCRSVADGQLHVSIAVAGEGCAVAIPIPGFMDTEAFVTLTPAADDAPWPSEMIPLLAQVAEILGITLDRCDSDRALRLSDALTNSLLSALTSVVAVVDRSGIIVRVSEGWCRQARDKAANAYDFVGWNYCHVCERAAAAGNEEAASALEGLRSVLAGETTHFVLEYTEGTHADTRWWEMHVHRLAHPQLGALIVHAETTARKREAVDVNSSLHELAHAGRAITVGALAGSIAHEISQPLTAIMSNAQAGLRLLSNEPAGLVEVRDILQDVVADVRRAGEVIHRTRALLKNQENPRRPVHLSELTQDAMRLVRDEALARKVQITLGLARDLPLVTGDPVQLQQVVVNLVLNAFDALDEVDPAERHLTVTTRALLTGVELVVEDCGLGINAENMAHMFEPFVTTKKAGLGLGLHITRAIVESHGGFICAEPSPIRGLSMHVQLPEARPAGVPAELVRSA